VLAAVVAAARRSSPQVVFYAAATLRHLVFHGSVVPGLLAAWPDLPDLLGGIVLEGAPAAALKAAGAERPGGSRAAGSGRWGPRAVAGAREQEAALPRPRHALRPNPQPD
jgi:hypothetical protein